MKLRTLVYSINKIGVQILGGIILDNVSKILGKKIDIVGIDACLMNMVEVACQIKGSTDILIGSENTEPFDGWPYDKILFDFENDLENDANINLNITAGRVVQEYLNSYSFFDYPTLSTIDLSKIDNLTSSINNLAVALLNNWDNIKSTFSNSVFNKVQRFNVSDSDYSYADLGDLAKLIYQNDNMTANIKQAALNVLDNLADVVIANGYFGFDNGTVNGLTIWFPDANIFNEQIEHYEQLDFAKDTKWDEFLYNLTQ